MDVRHETFLEEILQGVTLVVTGYRGKIGRRW